MEGVARGALFRQRKEQMQSDDAVKKGAAQKPSVFCLVYQGMGVGEHQVMRLKVSAGARPEVFFR